MPHFPANLFHELIEKGFWLFGDEYFDAGLIIENKYGRFLEKISQMNSLKLMGSLGKNLTALEESKLIQSYADEQTKEFANWIWINSHLLKDLKYSDSLVDEFKKIGADHHRLCLKNINNGH